MRTVCVCACACASAGRVSLNLAPFASDQISGSHQRVQFRSAFQVGIVRLGSWVWRSGRLKLAQRRRASLAPRVASVSRNSHDGVQPALVGIPRATGCDNAVPDRGIDHDGAHATAAARQLRLLGH